MSSHLLFVYFVVIFGHLLVKKNLSCIYDELQQLSTRALCIRNTVLKDRVRWICLEDSELYPHTENNTMQAIIVYCKQFCVLSPTPRTRHIQRLFLVSTVIVFGVFGEENFGVLQQPSLCFVSDLLSKSALVCGFHSTSLVMCGAYFRHDDGYNVLFIFCVKLPV